MTSAHFDQLETRDPEQRELALFNMLPGLIQRAKDLAPGWARHLADVDPAAITSREELARLPILRKSSLPELQVAQLPVSTGSPVGGTAARASRSSSLVRA